MGIQVVCLELGGNACERKKRGRQLNLAGKAFSPRCRYDTRRKWAGGVPDHRADLTETQPTRWSRVSIREALRWAVMARPCLFPVPWACSVLGWGSRRSVNGLETVADPEILQQETFIH